jgi:hypothetical protein
MRRPTDDDSDLCFFTHRGTHPLLIHAVRRFAKLEKLQIQSERTIHFDVFFRAVPYFELYEPSFLSAGYPPPVFPALKWLLISGPIVQDPAYLIAALSVRNLPRLETMIIKAGIRNHSENTRASTCPSPAVEDICLENLQR